MKITKEMIDDCVNDLSINGKYSQLYQMIINSIEEQISDKQFNSMIDTLNYIGINCSRISKSEILYEYSILSKKL